MLATWQLVLRVCDHYRHRTLHFDTYQAREHWRLTHGESVYNGHHVWSVTPHQHLLQSVRQWSCQYYFNELRFKYATFHMKDGHWNRLYHHALLNYCQLDLLDMIVMRGFSGSLEGKYHNISIIEKIHLMSMER